MLNLCSSRRTLENISHFVYCKWAIIIALEFIMWALAMSASLLPNPYPNPNLYPNPKLNLNPNLNLNPDPT